MVWARRIEEGGGNNESLPFFLVRKDKRLER